MAPFYRELKETMEIAPALLNDWYPVARSEAVLTDRPLAVHLLGQELVLWRAGQEVAAWQDLCVHRGTRLSLGRVQEGRLVCPYHGWQYDGSGRCVRIPAHPGQVPPTKARAKVYKARERYGLAWVSLGEPERDLPVFPEEGDPGYRKILCGPSPLVNAGAPRIIENFLDVAHFPFIHKGILGDPGHPDVPEYQVEAGPEGVIASGIRFYQPDPYGAGSGAHVAYTYRVWRPFAAYLAKVAEDGTRFTLAVFLTPNDECHTTAWFYMGANSGISTPEDEMVSFQNAIFEQDRPIVESQRPQLLPLDLDAELHLRCDRTAIAYRRWLKEQGIDFGTL